MTAIGSTTTDRLSDVAIHAGKYHDEQYILKKVLLSMVGDIVEDEHGEVMSIESSPIKTLLVSGPTGCGMRYFCSGAANDYELLMKTFIKKTGFGLTDLDIARVFPANEIATFSNKKLVAFLQDLQKCFFLVIDGLPDPEKCITSKIAIFKNFLDFRLNMKRKTVITTTLDPKAALKMLGPGTVTALEKGIEARLIQMRGNCYDVKPQHSMIPISGELKLVSGTGNDSDGKG